MKSTLLEAESKLTDRYQTTVPETVRKALHLHKQDKIHYTVQNDGNVLMSRADPVGEDLVLKQFLTFLAHDVQKNPQNIKSINNDLLKRIQALVNDVEIDIDEPLSDEDD